MRSRVFYYNTRVSEMVYLFPNYEWREVSTILDDDIDKYNKKYY